MSWALVTGQSTGAQGGAAESSISATFASASTIGNLIVARMVCFNNNALTFSAADTHNTYTQDVYLNSGTATYQAAIWHTIVTTSNTLTVTISQSGGSAYVAIAINEYTYTGTLAVDGTNTLAEASRNNPSISAVTVTGTDLVAAVFGTDASATFTAGGAGVLRYNANYSSGKAEGICAEDYMNVTSNTAASLTLGSTVACYGAAVAYFGTSGTTGKLFLPPTLSLGAGGPFFVSGVNG